MKDKNEEYKEKKETKMYYCKPLDPVKLPKLLVKAQKQN